MMFTDFGKYFCVGEMYGVDGPVELLADTVLNQYMTHLNDLGVFGSMREEYVQIMASKPADKHYSFYFLRGARPNIMFKGTFTDVRFHLSDKMFRGFFAFDGDDCIVQLDLGILMRKYGPEAVCALIDGIRQDFQPYNGKMPDVYFNLALLWGGN